MVEKLDLIAKDGFFIHKSSALEKGCSIGKNTKIWHYSHISKGSKIGKNCVLGQNTFMGGGAQIGNNVKIQNNVSLFDKVIIHDNVFCGPSVVFTNVLNPRAEINRKKEYKKTKINNGVTIGANATIVCGIEIGEYAFIAAGAVVTKNVKPFELIAGVPGKRIGWMSVYGIQMKFNKDNVYKCKFTKQIYKLTNNEVKIIK